MLYSFDRIIANSFTILAIKDIIACQLCGKPQEDNVCTNEKCHQGYYCAKCITGCSNCTKLLSLPRQTSNELAQLLVTAKVKCKYYPNGCNVSASYGKIEEHESQCSFNVQFWNESSYQHVPLYEKGKPQPSTQNEENPLLCYLLHSILIIRF